MTRSSHQPGQTVAPAVVVAEVIASCQLAGLLDQRSGSKPVRRSRSLRRSVADRRAAQQVVRGCRASATRRSRGACRRCPASDRVRSPWRRWRFAQCRRRPGTNPLLVTELCRCRGSRHSCQMFSSVTFQYRVSGGRNSSTSDSSGSSAKVPIMYRLSGVVSAPPSSAAAAVSSVLGCVSSSGLMVRCSVRELDDRPRHRGELRRPPRRR